MSKKYYKMNSAEMSFFLGNFISIADANKTELNISNETLLSLNAVKTDLDAKIVDRQAKQEAAVAATAALHQTMKNALDLISSVNNGVKSNKTVPNSLIELLGLDANDNNLTTIVAVAPTDLVAEGRSNGINYLRWKSGGNKPRTTYIIEAKIGDAEDYVFISVTTKMRFEHKNQTPGVRVFYRVKAVHSEQESAYSNEAVIYN